MAIFTYEAYDNAGAVLHGEYEGSSQDEVSQYLFKRSLTPVSITMLSGKRAGMLGFWASSPFEKLDSVDVMFLVRNLATTVKAGLSLVESLDILIADAEKNILKKVLREVQAMVKNGQQLSAGFEAYASSFPPVFVGMLKAGESSGQLDKTLAELGRYLGKEYALRSKIKSALMYPVILLVASTGVVALLLMFVLPRLTQAFLASGVELPLLTKFFLALSNILTWSYVFDGVVLVGMLWFFLYFRTTQLGKRLFFFIMSHAPVARDLVKKVALVRFSRTLSNLIGSGLSVVEALDLSAQSIGNRTYTLALNQVIDEVKTGSPISGALEKFPRLFPRMLVSLIVVGERTGTLGQILTTFADFYEEEVDGKLKDLTAALEPILLLLMGVLVGSIAVSIILPIYQLVGNFV